MTSYQINFLSNVVSAIVSAPNSALSVQSPQASSMLGEWGFLFFFFFVMIQKSKLRGMRLQEAKPVGYFLEWSTFSQDTTLGSTCYICTRHSHLTITQH